MIAQIIQMNEAFIMRAFLTDTNACKSEFTGDTDNQKGSARAYLVSNYYRC